MKRLLMLFALLSVLTACAQSPVMILDNVPTNRIDYGNFDPKDTVEGSLHLVTHVFGTNDCEISERIGCAKVGSRRLLCFNMTIVNAWTNNWAGPTITSRPDLFYYDTCHQHIHLVDWSIFSLLQGSRRLTVSGKMGWCLISGSPLLIGAVPYTNVNNYCTEPYLLKGWGDTYGANAACMWLDVTEIKPGKYTLLIQLDPKDQYGTPDDLSLDIKLTDTSVEVVESKGRGKRFK